MSDNNLFDIERLLSDTVLLIEIVVIFLIILTQLIVYFRNKRAIRKLRNAYPEIQELDIELVAVKPQKVGGHEEESNVSNEMGKVSTIKKDGRHSEVFNQIVEATNDYIIKNKGGVSFPALEQIANRKIKSWEEGIESVLVLPLYIGLLGTFSGVIVGLSKIVTVGFTDQAIQTFLGGVLIAMIASAFGLYLTVRSNGILKRAKQRNDEHEYNYLGFIRLNLLPPSHKTVPTDFKSLRYNLNSFHEEFVNYQKDLNGALGDTVKRFEDLREVFQSLKEMENGLGNINHFMKNNQSLMERQAQSIEEVTQRTARIGTEIDQVDGKLQNLKRPADAPIQTFEIESQEIAAPVSVPTNATTISEENWANMLERLEETETSTRQMASQVSNLYTFLQKNLGESNRKGFLNSFLFKLFTFTGIIAFLAAISAAVFYFLTIIYPNYF